MQDACVEIPSEKYDGQVCAFCPHDVEDEVQSIPNFGELKEENQRVQVDTSKIKREFANIFVPQAKYGTIGKHLYASCFHKSVEESSFAAF